MRRCATTFRVDLSPHGDNADGTRILSFSVGHRYLPVKGRPGRIETPVGAMQLPPLPPAFDALLMTLPLPVRSAIERANKIDGDAAAVLGALGHAGVLAERVISSDGEVLAIAHRPMLAKTADQLCQDGQVRLHESAFMRRGDIGWTIYRADTAAYIEINSATTDIGRLSRTLDTVGLTAVETLLLDNELLVNTTEDTARENAWEFQDALLHAVSVHGEATATGYGTRPRPGTSVVKQDCRGAGSRLPQRQRSTPPLHEVLVDRRSCRTFAAEPLSTSALVSVLDLALRSRSARLSGSRDVVFHSYPSAGALDEITTLVASTGPVAGVSLYRHKDHELQQLDDSTQRAHRVIEVLCAPCGIATPLPCTALVFVADYAVMAAKYASIAYANILRDVGCVYQTVSLAATAIGAGSCAVGGGWGRLEKRTLAEFLGGGVVVGAMVLGVPS